jgi:transposase-like protein
VSDRRRALVGAVRGGASRREAARLYSVGLATVQRWMERARNKALDEVDWTDRPCLPHTLQRTDASLEELVLTVRRELKETSALGEYGALAIRKELLDRVVVSVPCVRTIGRILERRGALDGRRRIRHRPPPPGWYLPEVAQGRSELDSFDVVEGLVIEGGINVEVLNGISLHGALVASWPDAAITAASTMKALTEHWRIFGLPAYAQFDNDTRFQGAHQFRDSIGRVIRLCLSLNVTPVFAPVQETGFQAAVESFNGRWQAKVWQRFHYDSLASVQAQSVKYVAAYRARLSSRIEQAPTRRAFPDHWQLDLQTHPAGRLVFLRRTNEQGQVGLLGHSFVVDKNWPHRLVRAEVDLDCGSIGFYALRRREPSTQPLLRTVDYQLPKRRFRDQGH